MAGRIKNPVKAGVKKEVRKMAEQPTKTAPASSGGSGGSSDNKIIAALCYIIGVLVPLFVIGTDKKKDKFLLFHAWQSLFFTVALFVVYVGLIVVTIVLSAIPGVNVVAGLLASCVFPLIGLGVFVYMLFLAYKSYQGVKVKIPMVGEYAEKQAMK